MRFLNPMARLCVLHICALIIAPTVMATPFHAADIDGSKSIILDELLRVIQFYNSGGLHCVPPDETSEDGYLPGPALAPGLCTPHSSDYLPQDWSVSLDELLRSIQFYNSNGYHVSCEGEDGFGVGSAPDTPCVQGPVTYTLLAPGIPFMRPSSLAGAASRQAYLTAFAGIEGSVERLGMLTDTTSYSASSLVLGMIFFRTDTEQGLSIWLDDSGFPFLLLTDGNVLEFVDHRVGEVDLLVFDGTTEFYFESIPMGALELKSGGEKDGQSTPEDLRELARSYRILSQVGTAVTCGVSAYFSPVLRVLIPTAVVSCAATIWNAIKLAGVENSDVDKVFDALSCVGDPVQCLAGDPLNNGAKVLERQAADLDAREQREPVARPTLDPPPGTYSPPILIDAETTTPGATIWFSYRGLKREYVVGSPLVLEPSSTPGTPAVFTVWAEKEGQRASSALRATYHFLESGEGEGGAEGEGAGEGEGDFEGEGEGAPVPQLRVAPASLVLTPAALKATVTVSRADGQFPRWSTRVEAGPGGETLNLRSRATASTRAEVEVLQFDPDRPVSTRIVAFENNDIPGDIVHVTTKVHNNHLSVSTMQVALSQQSPSATFDVINNGPAAMSWSLLEEGNFLSIVDTDGNEISGGNVTLGNGRSAVRVAPASGSGFTETSLLLMNNDNPENTVTVRVSSGSGAVSLARRQIDGPGYVPGGSVELEVTLSYPGASPLTILALREVIPAGWTFIGLTGGNMPGIAPAAGSAGTLNFSFGNTIPALPVSFRYRIAAPASASGDKLVRGNPIFAFNGSPSTQNGVSVETIVPQISTEGEPEGEGEPDDGLDDVTVDTRTPTIQIWDCGTEIDGDRATVFVNGVAVLDNIELFLQRTTIQLSLDDGPNTIVVRAENEGFLPPNTACLEISDVTSGDDVQLWDLAQGQTDEFRIIVEQ